MYNDIAEDFQHGKNFKIGSFCKIDPDVIVGDDVFISSHVTLKSGTRIGNRVIVDDLVYSSGGNQIGNDVILRGGCGIGRGVIIEDHAYICPHVKFIVVNDKREILLGTVVGHHAFIGTDALIGFGIKIPAYTIIGAKAFVNKQIMEAATYVGCPAKKLNNRTTEGRC
jgi:UDP-2-acetamido-3-amino-2,3-dideoxy-glucuronate N-acetyltransferase